MPVIPKTNLYLIIMIANCLIFLYAPVAKSQDSLRLPKQVLPPVLSREHFKIPFASLKDSSFKNRFLKSPQLVLPKFSKPFLAVGSGVIDYSFYYRSQVDTPFYQTDVYQHQVNGSVNMVLCNLIPFRINTLIRRTNSFLFRNITDVQIAYDVQSFQQKLYSNSLNNIRHTAEQFKDTLTGKLAELKSLEYLKMNFQFKNIFTIQKLVEANELLNVPALSWDKNISDSAAKRKSDSLRSKATAFIRLYNDSKGKIDSLKNAVDSIKSVYEKSLTRYRNLRRLGEGKISNYEEFKDIANDPEVKNRGVELLPAKYRWLMGLKKFSIGRNPLNYSDLTVKNNSLNGINVEYNSWYYAAFSAGLLDFHFRDFAISQPGKYKQYFYMGRFGIGRINKNFLIVSLFNGTKQIVTSGVINNLYRYHITGLSVEAKYQLSRNAYIKMEAAETVAPDFRKNPLKNNKWNLKDKTDKAYLLMAHLNIPKTRSSFDAYYKYTGANFQSFSTFTTSASLYSYNIKWDQYLLRKKLRITASVRSNEFTNPYLVQQYSNNTVFKSIQAVFRKNRWPVVSAAYTPLSQLTRVGETVYENRYNALNTSVYHNYKLGNLKAVSMIMFAQFYNNSKDSGFIYFNSKNLVFNQHLYSGSIDNGLNISQSSNSNYVFTVVDESVRKTFKKSGSILFGFKIHALSKMQPLMGYYTSYRLPVNRNLSFSFFYETGFIPGIKGTLIKNNIGNIQVSKSF
jgi:hypothetical protein